MMRYVLALLILVGSLQSPTPESVSSTLARAQALYYDARFKETIELLLPLDSTLRTQPARLKERIDVKLQIALAHVGLGQMQEARTRFSEICTLDPDYSLDPKKFASKVISVFEDAKAEHMKSQCEMICDEADRLLETEDSEALLALIQPVRSNCPCAEAAALDAATHFYEQGLDAYKQENFSTALQHFEMAMRFNPNYDLARSYIDLTYNRLKLDAERLFLQWRTEFDAREFGLAAATYRKLESANIEGSSTEALDKIHEGYQRQLSPLISSWKQACSSGDALSMGKIRRDAEDMLADPAVGKDLLAQMDKCERAGCTQLSPETAMARVKIREDAKLPPGIVPRPIPPNFALTVKVRVRIDDKGNVTVADPESIQSNVRSAVVDAANKWKFLAASSGSELQCIDTTIPIAFRP